MKLDFRYSTITVEKVLSALSTVRVNLIRDEYQLQDMIAEKLDREDIPFRKEYKLAPRNRIDFLVAGGIGIEIKKGKPYRRQVVEQLKRYAAFPEIQAVILVVERNVDIPRKINGKRCYSFGLNKLWGIAL